MLTKICIGIILVFLFLFGCSRVTAAKRHQTKQVQWREKFRQQAETLANRTIKEKKQAACLERTKNQIKESRIRPINREPRCTCTRVDCSYLGDNFVYSFPNATCELHYSHEMIKPANK